MEREVTQEYENRRAFFRINFNTLMCGKMTILSVNGIKVDKGFTPICIEDIGVGGVRFKSKLDMPINNKSILGINFCIGESEYTIPAKIVWKQQCNNSFVRYGCRFEIENNEIEKYISIFNKFSIACKKNFSNAYKACNEKRCPIKKEKF